MNREILFRGKRIDNGDWAYGYYVYIPVGRHGKHEHLIQTIEDNGKIGIWYDVIPETVGHYTGLTDKNGKRIFEWDIIFHLGLSDEEYREIGYVFWDEKVCQWRRTSNGTHHHGYIDTYRIGSDCLYEVIGNIHDNPELIGGVGDG